MNSDTLALHRTWVADRGGGGGGGSQGQAGREHFVQKKVISCAQNHRLVEVQHVVVWVRGAIIHGKQRYSEVVGRLITQDVLT